MTRPARPTFVAFCEKTLRLTFTVPWRVLLKVTIDGVQPRALRGAERTAARVLFGDIDEIDPALLRVLVWRLGRDSGKTTIAAALAIYGAWTHDLSRVGRGHVPAAFVVSATRPLAKIAVGVARGLLVGTELERFVTGDTTHGFLLRRPDGRVVEIACVAASKGGANLRGRPVVVLVLDESEFMGSEDGGAAVTDRAQINAVKPRLLWLVLLISTPWPTENVTADYFDRNFGHPVDAVAALGTSMFMRPSAQLAADIAHEMAVNEENARREYECEPGTRGGARMFDARMVDASVDEGRPLVVAAPRDATLGIGGDLGLEHDSSTIVVMARVSDSYQLLEANELRPRRGAPLVPGDVVRGDWAPTMRRHGRTDIMLDAFYRRSAEEHLRAEDMRLVEAPEGNQGKYDTYACLREVIHSGKLTIPKIPRLVAQLKAVTQTPIDRGRYKITSPRRAGQGHGDLVSALVLAVWSAHEGSSGSPHPGFWYAGPSIDDLGVI